MQLDLTRYRQPLAHFSKTFEPAEVEQQGDSYRIVQPVALDFDIHKDKDRFRLEGTVRTELEIPCSRCLEPFRLQIDAPFDLRYLPASAMSAEEDSGIEEEDLETSYYRNDQIDLNELLREQFYLALPMKPLCQEECRGLCPQCGTNLNQSTCACAPEWKDPRLAPLEAIKRNQNRSQNNA